MEADDLSERRKIAGQLLQEVLAGNTSPASARDRWPDSGGDASLDSAFHALFHFEDDEDVRKRDPKYADWQTSQLKQLADALLRGTSVSEDQIDWLTPRPQR